MSEQVVESSLGIPTRACVLGVEFTGGTIKQVLVNVSGEPYLDLKKEAMAVMSRE